MLSQLSHIWFFATPCTAAHQAPLSMEFSRKEYGNGLPCPSPGDLPHPGIKLGSPTWQADSLPIETPGKCPIKANHTTFQTSQVTLVVKETACQCRRCKRCEFNHCVGKIPLRKAWQPTPVSFPGESHGQRSLSGYSPETCKESDKTEATEHFIPHFKVTLAFWDGPHSVVCVSFK